MGELFQWHVRTHAGKESWCCCADGCLSTGRVHQLWAFLSHLHALARVHAKECRRSRLDAWQRLYSSCDRRDDRMHLRSCRCWTCWMWTLRSSCYCTLLNATVTLVTSGPRMTSLSTASYSTFLNMALYSQS